MKACYWALKNALLIGLLLQATLTHHQGSSNVALFLIWLTIAINLLTTRKDIRQQSIDEKRKPAVPLKISQASNAIILGILIYFGWWISGISWLVSMCLCATYWDAVQKGIAEAEAEADQQKANSPSFQNIPATIRRPGKYAKMETEQ